MTMIETEEFNDAVRALNDLAAAGDEISENLVSIFLEEFDIEEEAFTSFIATHAEKFLRTSPNIAIAILGLGAWVFQCAFLIGRSSIQNGTEAQ